MSVTSIPDFSNVSDISQVIKEKKELQNIETQTEEKKLSSDCVKVEVKKGITASEVSFTPKSSIPELAQRIKELHEKVLRLEQEIDKTQLELDNFDQNALDKIKQAEAELKRVKEELGVLVTKAEKDLDITIKTHREIVNKAEANLKEAEHPGILDLERQIENTKTTIVRIENKIVDIKNYIANGNWKIEQAKKDHIQADNLKSEANIFIQNADKKGIEAQKHEAEADKYEAMARPYREKAEQYDREYKHNLEKVKTAGRHIYLIAEGRDYPGYNNYTGYPGYNYPGYSYPGWFGWEPDYTDEWLMQSYIGRAHNKVEAIRREAQNYENSVHKYESEINKLQDKKVEIQVKINTSQNPEEIKQLQTQLNQVNNEIEINRNKITEARNKALELGNKYKFKQQELWDSEYHWRNSLSDAKFSKQNYETEIAKAKEYEGKAKQEDKIAEGLRNEEKQLRNKAEINQNKANELLEEAHKFEIEGPQQVQEGEKNLKLEQSSLQKEQDHLKDLEYKKEHLPPGNPEVIAKAQKELKEARENQNIAVKQAESILEQKQLEYKEGVNKAQEVVDKAKKEKEEGAQPFILKLSDLKEQKSTALSEINLLKKDYDRKFIEDELSKINDSWWNWKSDDQVRELISKNRELDGKLEAIYPNATVEQKIKMIKMLLSGFCFNDDERAILKVLQAAKERGELDAILENPKTTLKRLDWKINGKENTQLHQIVGK